MQVKLYEMRKRAKMSQEEIANHLGISRNSYGQKERGQVPFLIDEMFAISDLFKKDLDYIFLSRGNQNGYKDKQNL